MILVNILLFLVTLPFRLIGTIISGILNVTGRFISFVTDIAGAYIKTFGVIIMVVFAAAMLMGFLNVGGINGLPHWWIYPLIGLGLGAGIFFLSDFGEWLGDKLEEWGDSLFQLSWTMIDL